MIAALLTTVLFAATAVFARRAALALGATLANFCRLLLAAGLLGLWTWWFGRGAGLAFEWFFLSGLAGFGLGGLMMFQALPRAGSNLSMLIVQTGSGIVALIVERLWLGTTLTPAQLACVLAVVAGVAIGLAPRALPAVSRRTLLLGAGCAGLSAVGQGLGAVLSRRAFAAARDLGGTVDPGTAAFERALAGLLVAGLALFVAHRQARALHVPLRADRRAKAWPWVLANTMAGPVLGVACFQWALSTTPAGIVQPIVAAAPLLTAPIAWRFGEAIPRGHYFLGASLAVGGAALLTYLR
ncbi:MAG: EamA family transporter [Verrucomicrobia bacterium]|nr:MAG: EamA family transporter [Verrucomicrobiota bacterium]